MDAEGIRRRGLNRMIVAISLLWFYQTLLAGAGGQTTLSSVDFAAADERAKGRTLGAIAASQIQLPIEDVIRLIRLGAADSSPVVRQTAMAAISGRATISRWAGTQGPQVGPAPNGDPPRPPRPVIPLEWSDDQRILREALHDTCVSLLQTDPIVQVRREALRAVGNLYLPARATDVADEELIALLVDRYRTDDDAWIRHDVVQAFASLLNNTGPVRAVLRDALVDSEEVVRQAALGALEPQREPKLSFADARDLILTSVKSSDGGVRWGAVRALNLFGASAREYVPLLEGLRITDPDPRVRESAGLAIEAIERAVRQ
jgi:HEAT repeat protein